MVGFVPIKKEEEKKGELIENQSLPDIFDFSLPLTDCFVDFDSIKEWLEEDPPIGPPPYTIDDIGVEMSDYGVELGSNEFRGKGSGVEGCYVDGEDKNVGTLGVIQQEKNIEKGCPGYEGVKVGSLVNLVQDSGGVGVVEKYIEKGSQKGVEIIESEEGELEEVGVSIEEELKRVSLNRVFNDSDMVGVGGSKIGTGLVGDEANMVKIDIAGDGVKQSSEILNVDGDKGGKQEVVSDKAESGSESESESESSSSSSSSSSGSSSSSASDTSSDEGDEEEDEESKRKTGTDMEDGEIIGSEADEMVAWTDDEDDGGNAVKGPIRSKNEIADLPPVPAVDVSLLPHHHTLPVGIILSVMGCQVIVEGVETHNPLSEGSILWITDSRSPLGLVDEIFGPVKNPYYIVRYNSETEVPAGVQEGTQISFVPEYADHVLNNATNLYRKGYDASGENDEELSDEAEFSDDEKEAEYKKLKKMKKRGTKDGKGGDDRKFDQRKPKNRFGVEKHEQSIAKQTNDVANNVSTQHFVQSPVVSSGARPVFSSGFTPSHPLPQLGMAPGSNATTPNNVWFNGNPSQQNAGSGFPMNPQMQGGMAWPQGNHQQPQTPFLNMAAFQQNMHMNPSLAANLAAMAGQTNFQPGPFAPFPGGISPNFFNQSLFGMGMQGNALTQPNFGANAVSSSALQQHGGMAQNFLNQTIMGMGMQGQNAPASTNIGANAVSSNGFQSQPLSSNPGQDASQNNYRGGQDGVQNFNRGGQDGVQNFNSGTHRGGGRRPFHRGGGRFRGGRGRHPN